MSENQNPENQNEQLVSSPISEVFKRIVTDAEFKKQVIDNPDEALKDYDISEAQMIMIKNLTAEDLDKLTPENLEEFFAADAAVYTPDESEVMDEDAYSAEDFEELDDETKK